METTQWKTLMADHASLIVSGIKRLGPMVTLQDAGAIAAAIPQSAFSEEHRAAILTLVNMRACDSSKSGGGLEQNLVRQHLKPQEHLNMHFYLTDADWKSLQNESLTIEAKVQVIIARSKAIRLFSCSGWRSHASFSSPAGAPSSRSRPTKSCSWSRRGSRSSGLQGLCDAVPPGLRV